MHDIAGDHVSVDCRDAEGGKASQDGGLACGNTAVIKPEGIDLLPIADQIDFLLQAMKKSAKNLEFERAARLRDEIKALKEKQKSDKKRTRKLPK